MRDVRGLRKAPEYEQRLQRAMAPRITNADGSYSTHSMAVDADRNGNWMAYPTVQPDDSGVLRRLGAEEAMRIARRTQNFKAFGKNGAAALAYGEGDYKRGTVADSPHNREQMLGRVMRGERPIGYVNPHAPTYYNGPVRDRSRK